MLWSGLTYGSSIVAYTRFQLYQAQLLLFAGDTATISTHRSLAYWYRTFTFDERLASRTATARLQAIQILDRPVERTFRPVPETHYLMGRERQNPL